MAALKKYLFGTFSMFTFSSQMPFQTIKVTHSGATGESSKNVAKVSADVRPENVMSFLCGK